MKRTRLQDIPRRVYIRYGLLSLPGLAVLILVLVVIQRWVPIPIWLWATLICLWIAKEMILLPFVWRSYDDARSDEYRAMVGRQGVARDRLAPTGFVLIRGELWKAEKLRHAPPIAKGQSVRVKNIEGLKLFVEADNSRASDGQRR